MCASLRLHSRSHPTLRNSNLNMTYMGLLLRVYRLQSASPLQQPYLARVELDLCLRRVQLVARFQLSSLQRLTLGR